MWKGSEPIEQIQAEHDERLFKHWSSLSKSQRQLHSQRVTQVVLSYPVTLASSKGQISHSKPYAQKKHFIKQTSVICTQIDNIKFCFLLLIIIIF